MPKLTPRQREILGHIERLTKENGFPPTLQELTDVMGLANVSSVYNYLMTLERKGYICRDANKARTVRILEPARILIDMQGT